MSSEAATTFQERAERRSARVLALQLLGPCTALAGLVWAVAQPYRLTLLHPRGEGFWALAVQPPLLVVVVGVLFAVVVAPGLLEDLEPHDDDAATF
jgi:ABC-type uncharacterized transport system permease subunit